MRITGKLAKMIEKKLGLPPRPKIKVPNRKQEFLALCRHHKLPEPEPEYYFALPRLWRFDWVFGSLGWSPVAVEIDGGIFGRGKPCRACGRRPVGAHSSITQQIRDREKFNEAALLKYRVLHFTPDQVYRTGEAFAVIKRALGVSVEIEEVGR